MWSIDHFSLFEGRMTDLFVTKQAEIEREKLLIEGVE
jgi:hypothetical protein